MAAWSGAPTMPRNQEMRWTRHKAIPYFGWKWSVDLDEFPNNLEIVNWCLDNLDCIKLKFRQNGEWLDIHYLADEKGLFYYNNTVHGRLPIFIRIGLKTDNDATAFKLRWGFQND